MSDESRSSVPAPSAHHGQVIVVGVDFAPASEEALRQAAELAARGDAELHVAHCLPPPEGRASHLDRLVDDIALAREQLVDWVASRLRGQGGLGGRAVGFHVRVGPCASALLQLAADLEADMIVIGGRAHGLARFFATSLEQRLLRGARCPVLVARDKEYAASARSPTIEPPCPACVETRRVTRGETWWCERHATRHVRAHTYSYSRRMPFAEHDSEVVPTGASPSR